MTVSVAITTYCRPEGLNRTLESLSKQTRMPDEVIVSDNASPDNTEEIARKWAPYFSNFRYIKNPENIGMPGNLNNAIEATTGDLVINLHDADRYRKDLLEKTEAMMLKHPEAGMVFWPSTRSYEVERGLESLTPGREFFKRHFVGETSSKIWGTTMVRREVYNELMPFDARFGPWADVDMWMRICLSWSIAYIHEPLVEMYAEEGQFRYWSWDKMIPVRDSFYLNICRHFTEPAERNRAFSLQRKAYRRQWFRHMLGRLRRGQLKSVFHGLKSFKQYAAIPDEFKSV